MSVDEWRRSEIQTAEGVPLRETNAERSLAISAMISSQPRPRWSTVVSRNGWAIEVTAVHGDS